MIRKKATEIIDNILDNKLVFLGGFFLVYAATYLFLIAIDFVPESKADIENETVLDSGIVETETTELTEVSVADNNELSPVMPTSVYIERLDRVVKVSNPNSRSIEVLDNALLDGAVRHPDSALLGQEGNVFIVAHSSYLPTVFNENYQAFNGIQNLEWGDTIEVRSENRVHIYRVDRVYKATANDATIIPIAGVGKRLTLATCNSFGSVTDRFIVEATQVAVKTG